MLIRVYVTLPVVNGKGIASAVVVTDSLGDSVEAGCSHLGYPKGSLVSEK